MAATSLMHRNPAAVAAFVVAAGGAAAILAAYFFQFVLHLPPCPLCLEQRIPYYVAIPLALVVAVAAMRSAPRPLVATGLVILLCAMLVGAGLGLYHAGVEWKWWDGPQDCSGPLVPLGSAKDLLARMERATFVRCDEAAWRFLGLSLAGYNVLISLFLAAVAGYGLASLRTASRSSAGERISAAA